MVVLDLERMSWRRTMFIGSELDGFMVAVGSSSVGDGRRMISSIESIDIRSNRQVRILSQLSDGGGRVRIYMRERIRLVCPKSLS